MEKEAFFYLLRHRMFNATKYSCSSNVRSKKGPIDYDSLSRIMLSKGTSHRGRLKKAKKTFKNMLEKTNIPFLMRDDCKSV